MKKPLLILALLFLLIYIVPLGIRPMVQPDETRYAEIAREMIASGDYVTPHLNGLRYFEKPVFGYWLYAASMKVFGENAFALRLPCALAAGLSALGIFLMMRRFGGGTLPALMAASIFLTMPMVFVMANLGILDGILSCLLTLSLLCMYNALLEPYFTPRKALWLMACGALCGLAFLTKGFLAFAVPGLTITAFLVWERRWKDFLTLPWIPALAALLVAFPWAVAVHIAEPSYWHYFFWVEHIQRFFGKEAAQHAEPFWFFLPVLLGGAAIWILLLPSAIGGLLHKGCFENPFLRYCVCWFALPFLFFSLSTGKLPPYILPCFAPFSILLAEGLYRCHCKKSDKAFQWTLWILSPLLGVALTLFALNQLTGFPATLYGKGESVKWMVGFIAGLLWLFCLVSAMKEKEVWSKMAYFCIGILPLFFAFSFIVPNLILERKAPSVFLEKCKEDVAPDTAVVSWRDPAQSVCWAFKRNDVWLHLSGGEMDDGLKFQDSRHRLLDNNGLKALIERKRNNGGVLLILPLKILSDAAPALDNPRWAKTWGGPKGYAMLKF